MTQPSKRESASDPYAAKQLALARIQMRGGQHMASMSTILRMHPVSLDASFIEATKQLILAQNFIHLERNDDAQTHLGLISPAVRLQSKELACQVALYRGIIRRREGYFAWKRGDNASALSAVQESLDLFGESQYEAAVIGNTLTGLNAQLNEVYCKNLSIRLRNPPQQHQMDALIVEAAVSAYEITLHTPRINLAECVTNQVIVADMASAAGHRPNNMANLDASTRYQVACRELFKKEETWTTLLLRHAMSIPMGVLPGVYARALVLATKLLPSGAPVDTCELLALRLFDALLQVQGETQTETGLTRKIRNAQVSVPYFGQRTRDKRCFR